MIPGSIPVHMSWQTMTAQQTQYLQNPQQLHLMAQQQQQLQQVQQQPNTTLQLQGTLGHSYTAASASVPAMTAAAAHNAAAVPAANAAAQQVRHLAADQVPGFATAAISQPFALSTAAFMQQAIQTATQQLQQPAPGLVAAAGVAAGAQLQQHQQQQQWPVASMQQPQLPPQFMPVHLSYQQQQQHANVVTMSQPSLPSEQQQQQNLKLDTAQLLAAAADDAAAQQFTKADAVRNCMRLQQLPQHLRHMQHDVVHIQLPSMPWQWTDWPVVNDSSSSSSGSSNVESFRPSQLAFHDHQQGKHPSLFKPQERPAEFMLESNKRVTVGFSATIGAGLKAWDPEIVGEGLSLVKLHGTCKITVKPSNQGHAANRVAAAAATSSAAAAGSAAAAAAATPADGAARDLLTLPEVEVQFVRMLVLRDTVQPQPAVQPQQVEQHGTPTTGQQQQHSTGPYWRPVQRPVDGKHYLVGCVCLNIFTGKEKKRRYWPVDKPLPVLTPVG
jgi:hypothetical protein